MHLRGEGSERGKVFPHGFRAEHGLTHYLVISPESVWTSCLKGAYGRAAASESPSRVCQLDAVRRLLVRFWPGRLLWSE